MMTMKTIKPSRQMEIMNIAYEHALNQLKYSNLRVCSQRALNEFFKEVPELKNNRDLSIDLINHQLDKIFAYIDENYEIIDDKPIKKIKK